MRLAITGLLLALTLPVVASAQIYKYTDASGNVVFTNQPPEGQAAETVELPPTNTVEAQKPAAAPGAAKAEAGAAYSVLELANVPDENALRSNNGNFNLGVAIEPRLKPGHALRLLMDGQPYGQPTNVPYFQVVNAERGAHTLAVEVIAQDKSIQQSAPVSITVQRISVNSPARGNP
ncbi:DUF4124 domain-containing protein [Pseudomonas sp. RIT-PI-AD]|uniref:DUF4124 domain-containing protein n=1 Tax=Pseudomonas sp. RIT-PI-AD TaxID=3035294 RepID=UPI0021D9E457|nr:DUF4124 domain-containing protein [Pseudomonas sp. RIT-PI-AD]